MYLKKKNRAYTVILLPLIISLAACGQQSKPVELPEHVGDIAFDSDIDDANFKICNASQVMQYYNFGKGVQYEGEKRAITEVFQKQYNEKDTPDESGAITIRFIVNCEGKTGRFRLTGMDNDYQEKTFDERITSQLLKITQSLSGWQKGYHNDKSFDYYQYLTFKIKNGQIIEILP